MITTDQDAISIFCKNVNRLRLSRKLTVENLSQMCGLTSHQIWIIESNKWKRGSNKAIGPGLKTVESIAKAFNISVAALLTADDTLKAQGADYITNKYLSLNHVDRLKMHKMIDVLFN